MHPEAMQPERQDVNSCHITVFRSESKPESDMQEVLFRIRFKERSCWLSRSPDGGTTVVSKSKLPAEEREFIELPYKFKQYDLCGIMVRRMLQMMCIDSNNLECFTSAISKFMHTVAKRGVCMKTVEVQIKVVHVITDGCQGFGCVNEHLVPSLMTVSQRIEPPLDNSHK